MKNLRAIVTSMVTTVLACGFCALSGCNGDDGGSGSGGDGGGGVTVSDSRTDGGKMSDLDREAAEYLSSRIAEYWLKGPGGWTTEYDIRNIGGERMPGIPDLQFHQYRDISFSVAPEELSDAQKLNGSDYRGVATFQGTPERYYHSRDMFDGRQGWQNWEDGGLLFKTIAIERRNGKWICEESDLFHYNKPAAGSVPEN